MDAGNCHCITLLLSTAISRPDKLSTFTICRCKLSRSITCLDDISQLITSVNTVEVLGFRTSNIKPFLYMAYCSKNGWIKMRNDKLR